MVVLSLVACGAEGASLQLFRGTGVVDCLTDTVDGPELFTIAATADFSNPGACVTDTGGKHWRAACEGSGRQSSDTKMDFIMTDSYLCGREHLVGHAGFTFSVQYADFGKLATGQCVRGMAGMFWKFVDSQNMVFPNCVAYNANTFFGANSDKSRTKLPGLQFLGMGVNMMTDDLTGDGIRSVNRPNVMELVGYENNVETFDSSWSTGAAWFKAANSQVIKSRTATDSSITTNFEDTRAVQTANSLSADVKAAYGVADASVSMKVSDSYEAAWKSSKVRSERKFEQGRYKMQLKNDQGQFTRQFLYRIWKAFRDYSENDDTVEGVPQWATEMAAVLVAEFGTHVITEVEMGGRVTVVVETSSCMSSDARTKAVEGQVCGGVKTARAKVCAGGATSDSTSSKTVSGVEQWSVGVEGGSRSVCTKDTCDFDTYAASVNEDTAEIIAVKLSEITSFLDLKKPVQMWNQEKSLVMDDDKIRLLKTALGKLIKAGAKTNLGVKACPTALPAGALSIGPSVEMLMMAIVPMFALLFL